MAFDEYVKRLVAEGWEEDARSRAELGPYQATVFVSVAQDTTHGSPYRLVLSGATPEGRKVLQEWGNDGHFFILADPQFHRDAGPGKPVLTFRRASGGNGFMCTNIRIFSLDNDSVREITPKLPPRWCAEEMEDADGDGKVELVVMVGDYEDYMYHCHACAPACERVFRWSRRRGGFVDASAGYPDFYRRDIADERKRMAEEPDDPWLGAPVDLLLDYWCMGKVNEGWREFKAHMDRMRPKLSEEDRVRVEEMEADLRSRLGIIER